MIDTGVFRLANDKNYLYFKNPKRIDETVLYEYIIECLKIIEGILVLERVETPLGEHFNATFEGKAFCIGVDTDYGVFIHSKDSEILSIIENKIVV